MGQDMLIQKAQEIHYYMYGSLNTFGLVGREWRAWFIIWHREMTLILAQVIKMIRNKEILEGLHRLFCELCQHIIEQKIKSNSCRIWVILASFIRNTLARELYQKALAMCGQSVLMRIFTWSLFYMFLLLNIFHHHY